MNARQVWVVLLVAFLLPSARADQVEMQNGDRYVGKILSLDPESLTLRSEILGTLKLPRTKVALMALDPARLDQHQTRTVESNKPPTTASTAPAQGTSARRTQAPAGVPGAELDLRSLSEDTNMVHEIQNQFLTGAGPAANKKFQDMLNALMSGKMSVGDLRLQAKSAADQVRSLKKDLGEDVGFALDGYLAILDQFVNESAPANTGTEPLSTTRTNGGGAVTEPKQASH